MRRRLPIVALMGCLAAGCGKEPPVEPERHEDAASSRAHDAPEPGTLRIDPAMLRDLRITTASAEARADAEEVTVLGELGVDEEAYAEVGTPLPARVLRLLASPGDSVRQGRPLVELQSTELGRARAAHLGARARAELAEQVVARKRGLVAERIAPLRELQEAEAEAKTAQAEARSAAAALQAIGVDPANEEGAGGDPSLLVLRSPIAGTVIQREAARGQLAEPSRTLFRVADLSRLWLTVHAFERDAIRVVAGATARVTFPALPGRELTGTIAAIGRQVDVTSRTIPVRIEIANEGGVLRPGMSATARLPVGGARGTIIAVPAAALQRMEEGWCVFLPKEPGLFEMRQVGRGRDLGGEVEIVSGLRPGETVVLEGAFLLKAEAEKSRGGGDHHDH